MSFFSILCLSPVIEEHYHTITLHLIYYRLESGFGLTRYSFPIPCETHLFCPFSPSPKLSYYIPRKRVFTIIILAIHPIILCSLSPCPEPVGFPSFAYDIIMSCLPSCSSYHPFHLMSNSAQAFLVLPLAPCSIINHFLLRVCALPKSPLYFHVFQHAQLEIPVCIFWSFVIDSCIRSSCTSIHDQSCYEHTVWR